MSMFSQGRWTRLAAGTLGSMALWSGISYAARWREVGQPEGPAVGIAYVDLDSVHEEDGFRVALFLTVYSDPAANAHNIKLDRIAQQTAFDCAAHRFALVSTVGFFQGKKVGTSSERDDWRDSFRAIPEDTFSQRAYRLAWHFTHRSPSRQQRRAG
jgi:hypothetical protein